MLRSLFRRIFAIAIANLYLFFGGLGVMVIDQSSAIAAPTQATVEWLDPPETSAQYQKAEPGVDLEFPRDFGAHPKFQTEWWYYTGNLESEEGREFGYQFTIFRRAIAPEEEAIQLANSSEWRTNQIYFSHFTVTDIANEQFYPNEKFSRGNSALAGATSKPYEVWIQDWGIAEQEDGIHLKANTDDVAIDLTLDAAIAPILQGDRGYSAKGPEPGNASYYYSIVQQPTSGTVTVDHQDFSVTGKSWKDHEYSTSALSKGTAGWDWFSLEFDDDTALMLYMLRDESGQPLTFSKGTFIDHHGEITQLSADDWELSVSKHWKSPKTKALYPAGWELTIPSLALNLEGHPLINNQELNVSTSYWEGAVAFKGTRQSSPIQAKGYVELTGYKESLTTLQ